MKDTYINYIKKSFIVQILRIPYTHVTYNSATFVFQDMKISLGYLSLEAADVSFRQHLVVALGVTFRAVGTWRNRATF